MRGGRWKLDEFRPEKPQWHPHLPTSPPRQVLANSQLLLLKVRFELFIDRRRSMILTFPTTFIESLRLWLLSEGFDLRNNSAASKYNLQADRESVAI
jgi:hypothetical protein